MKKKKELSIFIDESGDFGEYAPHSPYYIIGMVVHEQSNDISERVKHLDRYLDELGFRDGFVHLGPLIRKELGYKNMTVSERVRVLWRMITFIRTVPFM